MIHNLTPAQLQLHNRAVKLGAQHRRTEWEMIKLLQEIERDQFYKKLERSSLFQYAVMNMGLSEPVAYGLVAVARKASQIVALARALRMQKLSASHAQRLLSVITYDNAEALVEFARTHSAREIDREVARLQSKAGQEKQVTIKISLSTFDKLKRAGCLRGGKAKNMAEMVAALVDDFLERHDPVKKAERHAARHEKSSAAKPEFCTYRVDAPSTNQASSPGRVVTRQTANTTSSPTKKRVPLMARQKHAVNLRDQGRCTFRDTQGLRCTNERYLDIHHLRPVSRGGDNGVDNLATLCAFHHDLVHQLSFAIEGRTSWLRSPVRTYEYSCTSPHIRTITDVDAQIALSNKQCHSNHRP